MKKFLVVVGGMKIRLILCFQGNENHNGMKKLEAGGGKVIINEISRVVSNIYGT